MLESSATCGDQCMPNCMSEKKVLNSMIVTDRERHCVMLHQVIYVASKGSSRISFLW